MASISKRPSRHLLPLPSLIFNKSRNDPPAVALLLLDEHPDEAITALPTAAEEPTPVRGSFHQEPAKSIWRRVWGRLKKLKFSLFRTHENPSKELTIGTPYNFQHVYGLSSDAVGNDVGYRSLAMEQQRPHEYQGARIVVRESVISNDSAWTDVVE